MKKSEILLQEEEEEEEVFVEKYQGIWVGSVAFEL